MKHSYDHKNLFYDLFINDNAHIENAISSEKIIGSKKLCVHTIDEIKTRIDKIHNIGVVFIGGLPASGISEISAMLKDELSKKIIILDLDNYYCGAEQLPHEVIGEWGINWYDPRVIDWTLLERHIRKLLNGEKVDVPVYDYKRYERVGDQCEELIMNNEQILVVVGIHAHRQFADFSGVKDLKTLRLFTVAPFMERLLRKLIKDVKVRKIKLIDSLNTCEIIQNIEKRLLIPGFNHSGHPFFEENEVDMIINTSEKDEINLYKGILEVPLKNIVSKRDHDLNPHAQRLIRRVLKSLEQIVEYEKKITRDSFLWKMFNLYQDHLKLTGVETGDLGPAIIMGDQAWSTLKDSNHFHFVVTRLKDKYLHDQYEMLPEDQKRVFDIIGELFKCLCEKRKDEDCFFTLIEEMYLINSKHVSKEKIKRRVNALINDFQLMYNRLSEIPSRRESILSSVIKNFFSLAALLTGISISDLKKEKIWRKGLSWYVIAFSLFEDPENSGKSLFDIYTEFESVRRRIFGKKDWFKKEKDEANNTVLQILPDIKSSLTDFMSCLEDETFWCVDE